MDKIREIKPENLKLKNKLAKTNSTTASSVVPNRATASSVVLLVLASIVF